MKKVESLLADEVRRCADEVRRLQRERPDARAMWVSYCDDTHGGRKDPMMHTVASLKRFLLMVRV